MDGGCTVEGAGRRKVCGLRRIDGGVTVERSICRKEGGGGVSEGVCISVVGVMDGSAIQVNAVRKSKRAGVSVNDG